MTAQLSRASHITPLVPGALDWQTQALCREIDGEFFPHPGQVQLARATKRICGHCDVRQECLDYALNNEEEHGIWGGKTVSERKRILHRAATA